MLGRPIEVIFADHQNKPDIGANIARQWIETEGVDLILDIPNYPPIVPNDASPRPFDSAAVLLHAAWPRPRP